jgi:hypothetical protein
VVADLEAELRHGAPARQLDGVVLAARRHRRVGNVRHPGEGVVQLGVGVAQGGGRPVEAVGQLLEAG